MSLVTSCPQCATIFVVRPEQLAAQKGKVRCGHCQQVFNALDSLQEPVTEEPTAHMEFAAEAIEMPPGTDVGIYGGADASIPPAAAQAPTEALDAGDNVKATEAQPKLKNVIAELLVPIDLSVDESSQTGIEAPATETNAKPVENNSRASQPRALADIEIEGKLQQARRHKVNRVSLILLCLILMIAAALQCIYFMRTAITTQWPVLKPDFVTACKFLGCTVDLAANADLLTVDDSDLHEDSDRPGLIRLSTTLVNNAGFRQRYPMLELTLTDANESPVLRRTFKPAEYLPGTVDVAAGLAAAEEVHIKLSLAIGEKTVSGYRVYILY